MSREIKFRIWDNLKKEWVSNKAIWRILTKENGIGEIAPPISFKQHPEGHSIQQFTNLTDHNGREIYEGDILVEYPENRQRIQLEDNIFEIRDDLPRTPLRDIIVRIGVVEYNAPSFNLRYSKISDSGAVSGFLFQGDNYEVIGNVFENSELLK